MRRYIFLLQSRKSQIRYYIFSIPKKLGAELPAATDRRTDELQCDQAADDIDRKRQRRGNHAARYQKNITRSARRRSRAGAG